jgi:hypothetical protein
LRQPPLTLPKSRQGANTITAGLLRLRQRHIATRQLHFLERAPQQINAIREFLCRPIQVIPLVQNLAVKDVG